MADATRTVLECPHFCEECIHGHVCTHKKDFENVRYHLSVELKENPSTYLKGPFSFSVRCQAYMSEHTGIR